MNNNLPDWIRALVIAVGSTMVGLTVGLLISNHASITLSRIGSAASVIGTAISIYIFLFPSPTNGEGIDATASTGTAEAQSTRSNNFGSPTGPSSQGTGSVQGASDTPTVPEEIDKILNSHNWKPAGQGPYPERIRPLLFKFFHSRKVSSRRVEAVLAVIGGLGFALSLLSILALVPTEAITHPFLDMAVNLYPDSLSSNPYPLFLYLVMASFGFGYFSTKRETTCPRGIPFALSSRGRYYRSKDVRQEVRHQDGEEYTVNVVDGVRVLHCRVHDEWYTRDESWEK